MFNTENNYSGNLKAARLESSEVCQVKLRELCGINAL